MSRIVPIGLLLSLAACGGGVLPARAPTVAAALTGTAELLEYEPAATRAELFRELARQSAAEAGSHGAVLFPLLTAHGDFVAAPALDAKLDLLLAADAGTPVLLTFSTADAFSEDRRDAFQGLSEREAAELVARSLLAQWQLAPTQPVEVVRAAGAPYAAAYLDGKLRLNPALVYMASAPATP